MDLFQTTQSVTANDASLTHVTGDADTTNMTAGADMAAVTAGADMTAVTAGSHVPPGELRRVKGAVMGRVGGSHSPVVAQWLPHHVEPPIIVEHEVLEYDWSNGQL